MATDHEVELLTEVMRRPIVVFKAYQKFGGDKEDTRSFDINTIQAFELPWTANVCV